MEINKVCEEFSASGQICVDDIKSLKDMGYKTIINNRPDNEEPGQLASKTLEDAARESGLSYVHIPFSPNQMTEKELQEMKAALASNEGPYFGFCRTGKRAVGLWTAVNG